jgi:26S proteasome regulatory subunit N9
VALAGDLVKFDSLSPQWQTEGDLLASQAALRQKITLLALMEMVFRAPAKDRSLSFDSIAQATRVPIDQVSVWLCAISIQRIISSLI